MGHRFQSSLGVLADDVDDGLVDDWSDLEEVLELIESTGRSVHTAGRELRTAAPGALRGALTGFATGGPMGAGIGAVVGGVGSRRQATPMTGALVAAGSSLPGLPGQPGANAAASQLLAALLRPEVVQALGAMALGPAGAASVPVAGTQVPVAAFANLVAMLATQAAAHQHAAMPPAVAVRAGDARRDDGAETRDDPNPRRGRRADVHPTRGVPAAMSRTCVPCEPWPSTSTSAGS